MSDEQAHLVKVARSFARERIAPYYRQREVEGAFDRATLLEMGRLGFFGLELPEEVGGLGLDCLTAGLVIEALSADDYNLGYIPVTVSLVGQILHRYGQPDVVRPWLQKMIAGEVIPCIALTEPSAGSDAADVSLKAVRDGDEYVLSGEKTSISMANQADVAVVFARTGTRESKARGVSAFLVPLDDSSVTRGTFDDHGGRSTGRGTLHFDGTRIPAAHLLGDENGGFVQVMPGSPWTRPGPSPVSGSPSASR
jgi:cyclohexanecarboxyl-CoA dehydrogenase